MKVDPDELKKLKSQTTDDVLARIPAEVKALNEVLTTNDDPVLGILLRFHLLVEELLGRIIDAHVEQPEQLEEARLNFFTKIAVAAALEPKLSKATLDAVRRLNELRNQCSHVHGKRITADDLDRVGRSFGGRYDQRRVEAHGDLKELSMRIFGEIYKPMLAATLIAERVAAHKIAVK